MTGDAAGVPLSTEGRWRADSWSPADFDTAEWVCRPHAWDYSLEGPLSPVRFWPEVDEATQKLVAYRGHIHMEEQQTTIWMDGRPHPPENALHTWSGFSTGQWEGDTLVVTTTHLKEAYIRRTGLMRSDQTTVRTRWRRMGNYLQATVIMYDPVYLSGAVHSRDDDVGLRSGDEDGPVSVRGSDRDCRPAWPGTALPPRTESVARPRSEPDRPIRHAVSTQTGRA